MVSLIVGWVAAAVLRLLFLDLLFFFLLEGSVMSVWAAAAVVAAADAVLLTP